MTNDSSLGRVAPSYVAPSVAAYGVSQYWPPHQTPETPLLSQDSKREARVRNKRGRELIRKQRVLAVEAERPMS